MRRLYTLQKSAHIFVHLTITAARTSSANAFAVMATIGVCLQLLRSMARIALAASQLFMRGIRISMKMMS